jgi:hypothetical protein
LLGKIAHNANVTPEHNEKYHEILRRRKIEEGQSKKYVARLAAGWPVEVDHRANGRPIVRMEDTGIDMGMQNQLAAGYANTQSKIGRGMIVSIDHWWAHPQRAGNLGCAGAFGGGKLESSIRNGE